MRHWVSYEENMRGVYDEKELMRIYFRQNDEANNEVCEKFSFDEWLAYMERCAVFYRHEYANGPTDPDEYADWWDMDDDGEWSLYVFEDHDDERPAFRGYVEWSNGFYEASYESDLVPWTEWGREMFATLDDAMRWCASWAHFPEEV